MKHHRRYARGKQPPYDLEYDRLRLSKSLTNISARQKDFTHAGNWNDRRFVQSLIVEWIGVEDRNGMYYYLEGDYWRTARIPGLEKRLVEFAILLQVHQTKRLNLGFNKPQTLPKELYDKQLATEAALDVALEELDYFKEALDKLPVAVPRNSKLFVRFGKKGLFGVKETDRHPDPRQTRLIEIDGQQILPSAKGLLIINDVRSPYHQMSCADYRGLIMKPWLKVQTRLLNEKLKLEKVLHAKGSRDAFPEQWQKRREQLFEKFPEWENLFSLKFEGLSIPSWPKDIQKHEIELKIEQDEK